MPHPWIEDFEQEQPYPFDVGVMGPQPDPWELPEYPAPRSERFLQMLDELASSRMEPNRPQGFLDNLALGLQASPPQMTIPPRTPLEAFIGGLVPTAARGFSQGRIQSRGLSEPNIQPRMEMLKLAGMGADQEAKSNAARLARAVQMRGLKSAAEKAAAPPKPAAAPAPVRLGEGDVLVDPTTGKRIAAGAPKPEPKKEGSSSSDYAISTARDAIVAVDGVFDKINKGTTGLFGAVSQWMPGTPAYNVRAQLKEVASNVAFQALTAMRAASKTGGALGPVSDKEGELLQAVKGSLDQAQSADQVMASLRKIKGSMMRMANAAAADDGKLALFPDAPPWDYDGRTPLPGDAGGQAAAPAAAPSGGSVQRWARDASGKPVKVQ